ncbi:hypothetical protein CRV08_09620 [Halarcobacter ebronensis]|uniref:Uncharacterized protein n=1 Tax=Halarcobacter ebronensis TaxID=1462615 RepID=A0A4V1LRB5_9BACT|nr:hypothetical protein [Halarcobacter ebronensis]RXJ67618.1 hypothetical protein CRV08_09620 [Halarcobacter ebronensis]
MGNEYNVIEAGSIICACGGKVTLSSSVPNLKIAGAKPLYLKDILGAAVACPRSKNPCTKVASISTAGTEVNVSATGLTYLLRTDGFTTDKGRAVILNSPGQNTSKIASIPSLENQDTQPEEWIPVEQNFDPEKIKKKTFKLYLLRKFQEVYKPLRATREFRSTSDTIGLNEVQEDFETIHSHTLAFVYVVENGKFTEYKIFNNGTLNAPKLKEISYQNTKTKEIKDHILLDGDKLYDVYYSNYTLTNLKDIKKLPKIDVDPANLSKQRGIYLKDIDSLNLYEIDKKQINAQVPKNKEKIPDNIVVYLDDIIGEIEDLYYGYSSNYNLAYTHNKAIFEEIKRSNSYSYTVANLVDYFYVSEFENKRYKDNLYTLRDCYKKFVELLFFNKELYNYLLSFKDIENIVHKDTNKRAFSYHKVLKNYWQSFFEYEFLYYAGQSTGLMNKLFYNKEFILVNGSKSFYNTNKSTKNLMDFTGSADYTLVKKDATEVLAHIIFCIFFLKDFEDDLYKHVDKAKIVHIKNEFLIAFRKIVPLPSIGRGKISDVQSVVENQTFYNATVHKDESSKKEKNFIQKAFSSDSKNNEFLNDFNQIDNLHIKKSFKYDEKIVFKSKLPYMQDNIEYYKEEGVTSPNKILPTIQKKLESDQLKELLSIYQNCTIDEFEYVVSSMNIMLSLCGNKIQLDEELKINGIFINDKISFLYDFTDDLVERKTKLSDTKKELLIKEYQVSQHFDEYLFQQILNQLLFKTTKKDKAKAFLDKYSKLCYSDSKDDANPTKEENKGTKEEEPLDVDQNIQTMQEQIFGSLKFISGVTGKLDKVLGEYLKDIERLEKEGKVIISKSRALQIGLAFKSYALFIAIANIKEYIYDNEDKDMQSTISLVKDISSVNSAIIGILQNEKFENLAQKFLDMVNDKSKGKLNIKVNFSNSKFLSGVAKGAGAVSAYAVIIISILDAIKYKKNEDYDALNATVGMITINIVALFVTSGIPLAIFVAITSIAYAIAMHYLVDSAFEAYLKKSLFYKSRYLVGKNQRNHSIYADGYPSKYLLESTNKNPELKKINSNGFKNPKEIFNFIGKNYKTNEIYFDTALNNELSFFICAMYGYKLEKTDLKTDQIIRRINGVQTNFRSHYGIKIPSIIANDDEFKLYFSPYGDEYMQFIGDLIQVGDNYLFNLFPEDTTYYNLSTLNNNLKTTNQISYIIIKSSLIDFKYKIELGDLSKILPYSDIYIDSLEQISFEPNDEQLIQGNNQ